MQNSIFLATTADNCEVYCTEKKFNRFTEDQKQLIGEALPKYVHKDFPFVYTFGFDRLVGETTLVEVEAYQKENVFWVYRKSNPIWRVPVLINGESRMTTYMTLLFDKKGDKVFVGDCYFGKRTLPLPGNPKAKKRGATYVKECHRFWQKHALSLSKDDIDVPRTLERMNEEEASRFMKVISK